MPELTPAEEEAILTRAGVRIVLGGHAKSVAPLTIDRNREWKKGLSEYIGVAFGDLAASAADWTQLVTTLAAMSDQHIALLVAYDETGSLGGREWIGGHATEREVWDGLKAVLDEAFPHLAELLRKVPPAVLLPTVLQLLANSTNSPSPAGRPTAALRNLKPRSRRASSSS